MLCPWKNDREKKMLKVFDTPWKITNQIGSWIDLPLVRILFAVNGIAWGKGWRFYGVPIIQKHRLSSMGFGVGLQLRSSTRSNPLGITHPVILATLNSTAQLIIGDDFAMSGGCICAAERICIGNKVAVGANSMIVDTDFHPLRAEVRAIRPQDAQTKPVILEDGVFVGANCIILKGVTIGSGSVIGAGSVVASCVPPGVIAAGNPARAIRNN